MFQPYSSKYYAILFYDKTQFLKGIRGYFEIILPLKLPY
ncbi:hypothetical protein N207_08145 [Helicobacter pylori UM114]|uniref:Uncharacterized protein n=1 Tax=Helicobacter pylori UM114 TaxID=1355531 RepID=T0F2Y3_HELPX|nr:hypothetical protein N207_08145 [Helicobacter pylori UM114]